MSDIESGTPEPDEQVTETSAPRPRPRPTAAAPDVSLAKSDTSPAGPVSAASRARRIGGRPVVPTAPPAGAGSETKPAPAATSAAKVTAQPKPPKPPKLPKAPKQPRAGAAVSPGLLWLPTAVLGVAALVLVVLIAIAAHGVYYAKDGPSSGARNSFQEQALAAAKTCIASINTYDYRKIPDAEAAALACTTGKFTAQLKSVYDTTIAKKAPPVKAVQTAQVNQAGIKDVSLNAQQVDVLVFGQLSLTNISTGSTPEFQPFGAILTMQKVGSQWLVAKAAADVGDAVGS